ncbi:MAG: TolB protein [Solirubrobacterales bacterium]|nr:TolB protein [Solirubrobacterales bacterium]
MLIALVAGVGDAAAAAPAGPRLAVAQVGPSFLGAKVITVGPTGADRRILAGGSFKRPPMPVGRVAWSPDGSRLVFAAMTRPPARFPILKQLFLLAADGGKPRPLKGTEGGVSAVFSPDGQVIAFGKERAVFKRRGDRLQFYSSTSIWLFDIQSGKSRQLTPWRNGLRQEPSSFSPDGSVIASTRTIDEQRPEAIAVKLDATGSSALVPGSAEDPVFSPDGSRIAFLRGPQRGFGKRGDLYTARPGGEDLRRLTNTPTLNETFPTWDPSGLRLAFGANGVISSVDELFSVSGGIRAINADGTCATDLLEYDGAFLAAPAWQPGPGREAGPISC